MSSLRRSLLGRFVEVRGAGSNVASLEVARFGSSINSEPTKPLIPSPKAANPKA